MANKVFANGNEVSCKAAKGMTIAALPDVCFTPPENPATPPGVPIPYPNTGKASDTTKGTKTVKISKKEVGMKNKSYFKTSYGDEAGCAAKKGVITSQNKGKVYFQAWSSDVKFEGQNAVRHFDITTNNHMSNPGDTPTWPYLDSISAGVTSTCQKEKEGVEKECGGKSHDEQCKHDDCKKAKKCMLVPYKPTGSQPKCCKGETPHHLVEVHSFCMPGDRSTPMPQFPNYDEGKAPCVCAQCPGGSRFQGEHGDLHAVQGVLELGAMAGKPANMKSMAWNYGEARDAGVKAHKATFPDSNCSDSCIVSQLNAYHQQPGMEVSDDTLLRTGPGSLGKKHGSQFQRGLELLDKMTRPFKGLIGA